MLACTPKGPIILAIGSACTVRRAPCRISALLVLDQSPRRRCSRARSAWRGPASRLSSSRLHEPSAAAGTSGSSRSGSATTAAEPRDAGAAAARAYRRTRTRTCARLRPACDAVAHRSAGEAGVLLGAHAHRVRAPVRAPGAAWQAPAGAPTGAPAGGV